VKAVRTNRILFISGISDPVIFLYDEIAGMMLLDAILPTVTGRPDSVAGRIDDSREMPCLA